MKNREIKRLEDIATKLQFSDQLELNSFYNSMRDYVAHEDRLVHFRMSWLLISQTVSFAAIGAIFKFENYDVSRLDLMAIIIFVSMFGLVFSMLSFSGIAAASRAVRALDRVYSPIFEMHGFPGLTGGGRRSAAEIGSIHLAIPLVLIALWVVLISVACFEIYNDHYNRVCRFFLFDCQEKSDIQFLLDSARFIFN